LSPSRQYAPKKQYWHLKRYQLISHRAHDTVELLRRETPRPDIWQANSPALNPVDYRVWAYCFIAARARVSSTNPQYGRVAEASCCDMG